MLASPTSHHIRICCIASKMNMRKRGNFRSWSPRELIKVIHLCESTKSTTAKSTMTISWIFGSTRLVSRGRLIVYKRDWDMASYLQRIWQIDKGSRYNPLRHRYSEILHNSVDFKSRPINSNKTYSNWVLSPINLWLRSWLSRKIKRGNPIKT